MTTSNRYTRITIEFEGSKQCVYYCALIAKNDPETEAMLEEYKKLLG